VAELVNEATFEPEAVVERGDYKGAEAIEKAFKEVVEAPATQVVSDGGSGSSGHPGNTENSVGAVKGVDSGSGSTGTSNDENSTKLYESMLEERQRKSERKPVETSRSPGSNEGQFAPSFLPGSSVLSGANSGGSGEESGSRSPSSSGASIEAEGGENDGQHCSTMASGSFSTALSGAEKSAVNATSAVGDTARDLRSDRPVTLEQAIAGKAKVTDSNVGRMPPTSGEVLDGHLVTPEDGEDKGDVPYLPPFEDDEPRGEDDGDSSSDDPFGVPTPSPPPSAPEGGGEDAGDPFTDLGPGSYGTGSNPDPD
jgi:hypothetical protein